LIYIRRPCWWCSSRRRPLGRWQRCPLQPTDIWRSEIRPPFNGKISFPFRSHSVRIGATRLLF
jgi:hypothetical protein